MNSLRTRRRTWIAAVALVAAVTMSACGSSTSGDGTSSTAQDSTGPAATGSADPSAQENAPTKTVKTVIAADWFPAAYKDADGNLAGYYVDLVNNAAKMAGWKLEYTNMSFDGVIPGIQSGKFAFGNTLDITTDRMKVLDMVPVVQTALTLLTLKSKPDIANTDEAMCGLTLATKTGGNVDGLNAISAQCVKDGKPAIKMSQYPDTGAMTLAVQSGNVDAEIMFNTDVGPFMKDHPEFKSTGPSFQHVYVGVGFSKGSPLATEFANSINKMLADGTYAAILKKVDARNVEIRQAQVNPDPAKIN